MALESKFGYVDIIGIPADEPVFILRAKDCLAVDAITDYQRRVVHAYIRHGKSSSDFVDGIEASVEIFQEWAKNNPDKMKLPD